jgi:hypothetical protein
MYFHDSGAASGSYIMVDEVELAESFIGPPEGFTEAVPPSPPTDVTFTQSITAPGEVTSPMLYFAALSNGSGHVKSRLPMMEAGGD